MADLITRYYIGLLPDGLHISMKAGPDPAEKFADVGEHEPLDMDGYRLYPVDEAVWREWTADDEPDGVPPPSVERELAWAEQRYVNAINAILVAPPGGSDVERWRGYAEAYRQVCEVRRRDHGLPAVRYQSDEWRSANGVYSDAQVAEMRRVASTGG